MKLSLALAAILMLIALPDASAADPKRFEGAIKRFEAADKEQPPARGAILFTGSSSIRMWKTLAADMKGHATINRGFGGSQISDLLHYFDRVVSPYRPSRIVLYCGENDINAGETPQQVFGDFKTFESRVNKALPGTPIYYICMKPSPARWKKWPTFVIGNKLIREHCGRSERLHYIDVSAAMLGADGQPLPNIWQKDRLHMNAEGYKLWTRLVRQALKSDVPAGAAP
ncbi:MAG: SGNH/GDSL hydrolase family protein [Phycisphaerae bacterium]|nr:SGNH/GDSL hydrolase family protein [Phycisphaerae bacterium]